MDAVNLRSDWKREEIARIYHTPLLQLVFHAATIHTQCHPPGKVQVCSLLSIKTGGCTEDCSYCAQSVHYKTSIQAHKVLDAEEVLEAAILAKQEGASRFCMGASWREAKENKDFDKILTMVSEIRKLPMEVCCSLGMLSYDQALQLKKAGLSAYNHNIDTGAKFYSNVVSTRTFSDRLETIKNSMKAGLNVCSGGIIGLGESEEDRIDMILTLANMEKHPESVPVNLLIPVKGTPLQDQAPPSVWDMLRMIATIRIAMPETRIRLSAGRSALSHEQQALCFVAGANSLFAGEKLLTAPNVSRSKDQEMFELLGLQPLN